MYEDILGEVDRIKEVKNRRFDKEEEKEEDLFEDLMFEMEETD